MLRPQGAHPMRQHDTRKGKTMKTITFRGKEMTLYADQINAMGICRNGGTFAAKRGEFEVGTSRRYMRFILPRNREAMALIGLHETYKENATTAREKLFFKNHPRCQSGIFGNPRRINALLKQC